MQQVIDPTSGFSSKGIVEKALIYSTCVGTSWADLSVDDVIDVSVVWIGR